jgi:predicted dehydrogenase
MARLRTGFIGCGRIVGKHVGAVRELASELELAAVCDLIPERAETIATQTGARAYTEYR